MFSIQNIAFCHVCISGLDQNGLHAVLDILYINQRILDLWLKISRDLQRQQIYDVLVILFLLCLECFLNCNAYLGQGKFCYLSVAFHYSIHNLRSPSMLFHLNY